MLGLFVDVEPSHCCHPMVSLNQDGYEPNQMTEALKFVRTMMDASPQPILPADPCKQSPLLVVNCPCETTTILNDDQKYHVSLGVHNFKPEELQVKLVGNRLTVSGKHDERQDEHGFVSREFSRTYMLPKNVDSTSLTSNMDPDGHLSIEAKKKPMENPKERIISIETKMYDGNRENQVPRQK